LVRHKLSLMRAAETSTSKFRQLMREISLLLGYEATRELALEEIDITTPLETARLPVIAGKKLCLVSILRAGNGILDGLLDLVPAARVGHIGLYREPRTLQAIEYYLKLPDDLSERDVILVDPMLATGNSAVAAISRLVELRARSIKFVCLVAAPEGIATVHRVFPSVPIVVAAIDRCLDGHGYILPGLGAAGDALLGRQQGQEAERLRRQLTLDFVALLGSLIEQLDDLRLIGLRLGHLRPGGAHGRLGLLPHQLCIGAQGARVILEGGLLLVVEV